MSIISWFLGQRTLLIEGRRIERESFFILLSKIKSHIFVRNFDRKNVFKKSKIELTFGSVLAGTFFQIPQCRSGYFGKPN